MKKFLVLFLLFSGLSFADIEYYAVARISDKAVVSSFKHNTEIDTLKTVDSSRRVIFAITQSEYEGNILQATIDAAVAQAVADQKDVTKINKIYKAAFLVLAVDYAGKTGAQFKQDVIDKYNSL